MLKGEQIQLRLVRETDLPALYAAYADISNRGDFFPIGVPNLPTFMGQFRDNGFWAEKSGMMVIANDRDEILGHIEYFETVAYLDEYELSYILYSREHHGRGIAAEATRLMTGYLFDRRKINRIRLIIHVDNKASKRVAEKSGYTFEGVARGAWFHRGRNHDVDVWAITRADHYKQ